MQGGHLLRASMATRLLAGGLLFTVVLIAGVSGLLLVSRNQQTQTGALSNSDNRAGVAAQLLARVTEPQAQYAATSLASLATMQAALASGSASAVAGEFNVNAAVAVPGLSIVVLDANGHVLYTTECDSQSGGRTNHPPTAQCEVRPGAHVSADDPSVRQALAIAARPACRNAATLRGTGGTVCPAGVEGTELVAATMPAFDVAVPVFDAQNGSYAPVGVVVYSALLRTEFQRFGPVVGYTPVFATAGPSAQLIRFTGQNAAPSVAPAPSLLSQTQTDTAADGAVSAHAIYTVSGVGDVAGSFVALPAPGDTGVAGYLGVEVPLSVFAAGTAQDEQSIAELALTALVVVSVLVLFFVDRFVRRPVSRLERAVSRIADGDYSTDVPVTSHDELGRLAVSVNRMRAQIASYIRHIDGSLDRLQNVSRALTTTTGGLQRLQDAVLRAAAITAGADASAIMLVRKEQRLTVAARHGESRDTPLDPVFLDELLAGRPGRMQGNGHHVLGVPMSYQDAVTGALLTVTDKPVSDSDQRTLAALANNAAVAIENTRLFEQERDTVQRLSELNQMKSNFLATTQHELRTPVLAIQGQLELLTLAWERWNESAKMDIIRDIEISTRLLGELLETIVDFSMISSENLDLRQESIDVAAAADAALSDIRALFKGELPVEVLCFVSEGSVVRADPPRFRKVLRALLDNAVKFTPPGGHVALHAQPEPVTGLCRIELIDDGAGIAPEALPRIFDSFFQEDNSRTRKHGGMGMGLALVQRICQAHGATVTAESEQGQGARFTLLWPLAPDAAPPTIRRHDATTAAQRSAGLVPLR